MGADPRPQAGEAGTHLGPTTLVVCPREGWRPPQGSSHLPKFLVAREPASGPTLRYSSLGLPVPPNAGSGKKGRSGHAQVTHMSHVTSLAAARSIWESQSGSQ